MGVTWLGVGGLELLVGEEALGGHRGHGGRGWAGYPARTIEPDTQGSPDL